MIQRNETDSILVSNTNRRNERKFIWKHKQISLHIKFSMENFGNILRKHRQNFRTLKMWCYFNSKIIENENYDTKTKNNSNEPQFE